MLAGAILVWTLIAWGGRINLLVGGEDLWAWARIGGSIILALIVGAGLVVSPSSDWTRWGLVAFSVWTVLIWTRSLVVNWLGSGSMPFKLVHTLLAAGFFGLVWWAWNEQRRKPPSVKSAS